ncbi:MAG: T9SS type A sorting domain-containing protein, partial [Bacteroidales bacterium]|nr:T9SS type A sorting domain-containing protein [Bacteroidales bacterium]
NLNLDKINGDEIIAYCYQPMSGPELKTIYTINSDGSDNQMLMSADIGLNHHNWSPDGSKMACVGYADENTWSIYTFDTNGTNLSRLTTTDDVWDSEPSWSPDGSKIAFSRIYPDQNNLSEIWIMDMDGNNQYYSGIEGFAQKWSIDGNQFIYQSSIVGSSDIFISNIDGTDLQQITFTSESEGVPEWSHDGNRIAFVRFIYCQTDTYEIFVMNSDGSDEIQLTNNNYLDHYPRWSPDDSRLAFITDQLGEMQFDVYIMNADGTGKYQLTFSPSGYTAINPAWKPDINSNIQENIINIYGLQVYPNPCNRSATIEFSLNKDALIDVRITDLLGNDLISYTNKTKKSGKQSILWDGRNTYGDVVPAGVYTISVLSKNQSLSKMLIKF